MLLESITGATFLDTVLYTLLQFFFAKEIVHLQHNLSFQNNYLMKGLEGKADSNNDKKITNGELLAYLDDNVSQKALELGRQQNPSLAGDSEKVLISYR